MSSRFAGLFLVLFLLGLSLPAAAQQACFDIFALKTEAAIDTIELREIPMLSRYKYEIAGDGNVHYLRNSGARARYEWLIQNGLFVHVRDGKTILLNTEVSKKGRHYDDLLDNPLVEFVLSTNKQMFGMTRDELTRVFDETGRSVHHSTFMGGAPVNFAGNMIVENGRIKLIDNRSGHYRPTLEDFSLFLTWLKQQGVDISRTEIRIDGLEQLLDQRVPVRVLEEHMPEMVLVAHMQEGILHAGRLEAIRERIENEFKMTGDSLFLYRANFVWYYLNPTARDFLVSVANSHGRTMPDTTVGSPP